MKTNRCARIARQKIHLYDVYQLDVTPSVGVTLKPA